MGLSLNPGKFNVTINKKQKYNVTHTSDSLRTTGSNSDIAKINIQLHGCSFTYGMGVNDEETYPFIL